MVVLWTKKAKVKKTKSGQMMIEVLFSLSVVVMVLVALMTGTVVSLRNARYSKNMVLSNHYAQQAIEGVRAYKNRNGLSALCDTCCYEEVTSSGLGDTIDCDSEWGSIDDSIFQRRIEIYEDVADRKKVTSVISWEGSKCGADNLCETEIIGYLSEWDN